MQYSYDQHGVRYERALSSNSASTNWLFLPGGPGADSCYLRGLVELLALPGHSWLIDFPGNGSNVDQGKVNDNFDLWSEIFLPIIQSFENPILVGHSFGGMFPLLFPELENLLKGFVILNSAPCLWLEEAVLYSKQFNLPDLAAPMEEFTLYPSQQTFQAALEACTPYYFPEKTLEFGKAMLLQVPFAYEPAVWWQRKAIELNFSAKWIPQKVPTLIIGGTYDCIAPFSLFQKDLRFQRPNIHLYNIEDGGHMGWVENPDAVKAQFHFFSGMLH